MAKLNEKITVTLTRGQWLLVENELNMAAEHREGVTASRLRRITDALSEALVQPKA